MADDISSTLQSIDRRLASIEQNMVTSQQLQEAVEAVLSGMDELHTGHEKRFDRLEAGQQTLERQIGDLHLYDSQFGHHSPTIQSDNDEL